MENLEASVIVCVYNRREQLGACLASLAGQVARGFEVVVVDDGSADASAASAEAVFAAHAHLHGRVVRHECNRGITAAYNTGMRSARGSVVIYMDSDCTAEPGWVSAVIDYFRRRPCAAASGPVVDDARATLAEKAFCGAAMLGRGAIQGRDLVGGNMAFRRDVALQFPFDEAIKYGCIEEDIAWRMRRAGHAIDFIPDAIVHHYHPVDMAAYLRIGAKSGRGAACYWYKTGCYLGRDLVPLVLCLLTLPLGFLGAVWLLIPAAFFLLHQAALWFNQVAFKGKSWLMGVCLLPIENLFFAVKLGSVVATYLRLLCGGEEGIRKSKRAYWASQREQLRPAEDGRRS